MFSVMFCAPVTPQNPKTPFRILELFLLFMHMHTNMVASIAASIRFFLWLVCQFYWQLFRRLLLQWLPTRERLAPSWGLLHVPWRFACLRHDLLCHRHERLLDVGRVLCRSFQERHVEVGSELFAFFAWNLPFALVVDFVPHQHFTDVIIRVLFDLWNPSSHVVKRFPVVNCVDDDYALGTCSV